MKQFYEDHKFEILTLVIAAIGIIHLIVLWERVRFYDNINFLIAACFFTTTICVIFSLFGLFSFIKVVAFEKSTHNIEYVPISEDDIKKHSETDWKKLEEEMNKAIEQEERNFLSNKKANME